MSIQEKSKENSSIRLSARQVLGHWLVSQVGPAKRVRPKGFPSPFDVTDKTWSMANLALLRVSAIEGYEFVKPWLREWVEMNGLVKLDQVILVEDFIRRLSESLEGDPVFRFFDPDLENAVLAVSCLDTATFARQAKVDTRTVQRWVKTGILRDCWEFKRKVYIPEHELWRFLRERELFLEEEKIA